MNRIATAALVILTAPLVGCETDFGFQSTPDPEVIEDPGQMDVSLTEMVFEDLRPTSTQSQTLRITNVGDSTLHVYSGTLADDANGVFYTVEENTEDLSVGPGNYVDVLITCTLPDDHDGSAAYGVFHLDTNDSTSPLLDIPLHGYPEGWTEPEPDDTGDP